MDGCFRKCKECIIHYIGKCDAKRYDDLFIEITQESIKHQLTEYPCLTKKSWSEGDFNYIKAKYPELTSLVESVIAHDIKPLSREEYNALRAEDKKEAEKNFIRNRMNRIGYASF